MISSPACLLMGGVISNKLGNKHHFGENVLRVNKILAKKLKFSNYESYYIHTQEGADCVVKDV